MGKGKKGRKQDDDDWENDLEEIAKEAGIETHQDEDNFHLPQPSKKEKKKKKGKPQESLETEENGDLNTNPSQKSAFSALEIEDDDVMNGVATEDHQLSDDVTSQAMESKPKKKKEKKKKLTEEDADIEEILASLEVSEKSDDVGKKSKKKKKKQPLMDDGFNEEGENMAENNEEVVVKTKLPVEIDAVNEIDEPIVKTAAQKKAEKKEREKKKKEAEKLKALKKKKKEEEEKNTETKIEELIEPTEDGSGDGAKIEIETVSADVLQTPEDAREESGDDADDKAETKDKKKKKKKKKKDEEEKTKKTKKPGKAAILAMQEALEEVKREEERIKVEAEAKQKALEDAEEARLEKLRLEQERKERKKQKDKERKERLKKEGKLLTPAQKEQRRKAEAMLETMKLQGVIIPQKVAGEKPKKVQYGKKKKPSAKTTTQAPNVTENEGTPLEPASDLVEKNVVPVTNAKEVEDEASNSWDADEDDSWDMVKKDDANKLFLDKEVENVTDTQKDDKKDEGKEEMKQRKESQKSQSSIEESDESESEEDESSSEEEDSDSEDEGKMTAAMIKQRAKERIQKRKVSCELKRSIEKLRAPVICVLGHVDTGKTKILDKIRRTNVQDGEAGGITQQIGATNIPVANVREQTKMFKEFQEFDLKLPGLLVIDTPGHESFSNLRSRGSNLCDMAILVVDLMHGLEPQTIESINLLKQKKTPFVVALNKIDRIFEWMKSPQTQVESTICSQKKATMQAFNERLNVVIAQFAEQGLNAALHFNNPDEKSYISLVPTSAHSGDGIGDLMALICRLTQSRLARKLAYSEELESTVMEVKALPGLGTTIDVILVNGRLKEGDTLVTGGIEGAIVTQIRSILTPQPMRELRVKAQYIHHQELCAAQGVKLCAKDLEKVLAGSPVYIAHHPDEVEVLKEDVENFVSSSLKAIKLSERGVYVQASTLGSLEALLEFLKTSKIPYCGVNIGPVHRKDIMRCSVMLEHEPMYAVVLAFDVKIEKDAQDIADKEGVKIFSAEIIYHLFDQFTAYCENYKAKKREQFKHLAVFPVKLRIMPQHIFNTRDPIVLGVVIESGTLRLGTPMIVPSQNRIMLGYVTGIEANHKQQEKAASGQEVCVKIDSVPGEAPKLYGRHFTHEDVLVSRITRESIDVMKQYFREDMQKSDWQLTIELKRLLEIV